MSVWVVFARAGDGASVMLHIFEAEADAHKWIESRWIAERYLDCTLYVMEWNVVPTGTVADEE